MILTEDQIVKFRNDGVLVLDNFIPPNLLNAMKQRTDQLVADFQIDNHPLTRFTTDEDQHTGDEYFLASSEKIAYFLETDAFDMNGKLILPPAKSINKIGHYVHALDPVFSRFSSNDCVVSVLKSFGYRQPVLLQSMLILKQATVGGKVTAHQDHTFLYTEPASTLGFWFALEDANISNGCLWYIPGSHKWKVQRRFRRNRSYFASDDLKGCKGTVGEKAAVFEYEEGYQPLPETDDRYVPVEIKAGGCVLIHGSVVHKSHANISGNSRYAYAFHVIEGSYYYARENWLQMNELGKFNPLYSDSVPDGEKPILP